MKTARLTAAMACVVALTVSACGGSAQSGLDRTAHQKLTDGKTFTYAISSDPGTLDPAITVLSIARGVDQFLYDGLINLDTKGQPQAAIAEKWEASTTTASFTLRKGITCADGSPLTAKDVAGSINFVGDPANKSPIAGVTVKAGTKAVADEAAGTVKVTSGGPDAFLLRNLVNVPIVCAKGLADRKTLAKGENGTGMFTVSEIVPNDHYTLTRRKNYTWGPGQFDSKQPGLPDKVVIRVIPNMTTTSNLLLSGEVNAASVIGQDQQRLRAQRLFHSDLTVPFGELFFNQAPGRFGADRAMRRALVQALDLVQVGKVLTRGGSAPVKGMVTGNPPPCDGDSVTGKVPGFDVAAAKAALDAAGWKPGPDGIRVKDGKRLALTAVYGTQLGPTMAPGAELMQQGWKNAGIDVTLKGVDSPGLSQALFATGEWDISMAPLGLTLPSQLIPFASGAEPPQGTNFAHIKNATYDSLVAKAASQPGTAGCRDWLSAESALFERQDVVQFANSAIPTFGNKVRFEIANSFLKPSSIRMYS
ncbi:ABC transporter substrate-binding protein (plasmid) [Streptomyces sp. NBC_00257]|uniref:ABC transporter substrate-binding protein n=1 Tax=unclassified Streptomyces TaxID=2593676 RepID=UPI002251F223|nr:MULTISPECIES: ABC transporter substrate-binding protein [unclassified Streptomyces]WSW10355.1 ABC transporter substrate-binding protein [Streptomyces sp. NBC_01005]WTB60262.1 ABC transporter substrate-binding protein [Streptomyces sp. NBC_00826]WTC99862.1 ABC transporter substrate-binding protein [Streptomyces sp. NBC_01650]MCX4902489.1 ABC transporter substrate-binding protein [Streptomyces sp. NBC_00892]MCX5434470.1 ABC transporter substrate-binding protein [Streptomyces sp. NBC_00062]